MSLTIKNLSSNKVSTVWAEDGFIFKRQPKYLTDNEVHAMGKMLNTGYVPEFERLGIELIRMKFIEDVRMDIADGESIVEQANDILLKMKIRKLRHGDLTRPNIRWNGDKLYIIDWGESRIRRDPRPDKRPEGDDYWLERTIYQELGLSLK